MTPVSGRNRPSPARGEFQNDMSNLKESGQGQRLRGSRGVACCGLLVAVGQRHPSLLKGRVIERQQRAPAHVLALRGPARAALHVLAEFRRAPERTVLRARRRPSSRSLLDWSAAHPSLKDRGTNSRPRFIREDLPTTLNTVGKAWAR